MIDSHVHLNRREFAGEQAAVIERARAAGVRGFLNVGYDPVTCRESIALAEAHPDIWATVGIHPHDARLLADDQGNHHQQGLDLLLEIEELAAHPKVVAVGEIGLDFYRDLSPRPAQRTALLAQLELADRVGLPVVFHVRDAWQETLDFLDEVGPPRRKGILHSFSGGPEHVDWARDHGFLLGIGGPVTYKNSALPPLVARAGIGMLVLETDAPWLPPVPWRGQRNEPSYLEKTRDKVAEALGLAPAEVTARTTENFARLFGVEVPGA
ncbi:MAG: TatD family hydrolase [Candidatus Krumholzibacteriia bacterium]